MTSNELRLETEYKQLRKIQIKIVDVLENEPFGMSLEQLQNSCRISRKMVNYVLPTIKDIRFENGVYTFAGVAG